MKPAAKRPRIRNHATVRSAGPGQQTVHSLNDLGASFVQDTNPDPESPPPVADQSDDSDLMVLEENIADVPVYVPRGQRQEPISVEHTKRFKRLTKDGFEKADALTRRMVNNIQPVEQRWVGGETNRFLSGYDPRKDKDIEVVYKLREEEVRQMILEDMKQNVTHHQLPYTEVQIGRAHV